MILLSFLSIFNALSFFFGAECKEGNFYLTKNGFFKDKVNEFYHITTTKRSIFNSGRVTGGVDYYLQMKYNNPLSVKLVDIKDNNEKKVFKEAAKKQTHEVQIGDSSELIKSGFSTCYDDTDELKRRFCCVIYGTIVYVVFKCAAANGSFLCPAGKNYFTLDLIHKKNIYFFEHNTNHAVDTMPSVLFVDSQKAKIEDEIVHAKSGHNDYIYGYILGAELNLTLNGFFGKKVKRFYSFEGIYFAKEINSEQIQLVKAVTQLDKKVFQDAVEKRTHELVVKPLDIKDSEKVEFVSRETNQHVRMENSCYIRTDIDFNSLANESVVYSCEHADIRALCEGKKYFILKPDTIYIFDEIVNAKSKCTNVDTVPTIDFVDARNVKFGRRFWGFH